MRRCLLCGWVALVCLVGNRSALAEFDPQIGQAGSLGIARGSSSFVAWANSVESFTRGPQDRSNSASPLASFGTPSNALGSAGGIVSLGDGGSITLGFAQAIRNGQGADFAIFENGFLSGTSGLAYLELAFVEVSSDGQNFFRFASTSLTQTDTQVGSFGLLDARNLNNLAGKYVSGFGTGFNLDDLVGVSPLLDVNQVRFVRIIDVVGSIDPMYGSRDAQGRLINDPFKTAFGSGGFDLSGVGVIHTAVPEPASFAITLLGAAIVGCTTRRKIALRG